MMRIQRQIELKLLVRALTKYKESCDNDFEKEACDSMMIEAQMELKKFEAISDEL